MIKPHIIKGQKFSTPSYVGSLVTGVAAMANWALGSGKSESEENIVTAAKFLDIELYRGKPLVPCLAIGYHNGFQLWDISNLNKNEPDNTVVEVAANQCCRVRDFCVFNPCGGTKKSNKDGSYVLPILAIVSEDKDHINWPENKLQLYSLTEGRLLAPLDLISMNDVVISVMCCNNRLVVVCRNRLWLLDPYSLEKLHYIPVYRGGENPNICGGVASLGSRWLAYQCPFPREDSRKSFQGPEEINLDLKKKKAVSRTYFPSSSEQVMWYMGNALVDISTSLVRNSFWSGVEENEGKQLKEEGGYVQIIDLENSHYESNNQDQEVSNSSNIISYFKATTDGALSTMTFDPSGTLLATASERGNVINVYKISPVGNIFESHKCIYVLRRGVTSAIIKHITFSTDSKLITVTSTSKDTTHLYGINPTGGEVNVNSHVTKDQQSQEKTLTEQQAPKLSMIKPFGYYVQSTDTDINEKQTTNFSGAVKFDFRNTAEYSLYKLDSYGTLSHYRITLGHVDKQPTSLAATVHPVVYWDLKRSSKWVKLLLNPSFSKIPSPRAVEAPQRKKYTVWMSNIETSTSTKQYSPFIFTNSFPLNVYTEVPQFDKDRISDPVYQDKIYNTVTISKLQIPEPPLNSIRPSHPHLPQQPQKGKPKEQQIPQNNLNFNNPNFNNHNNNIHPIIKEEIKEKEKLIQKVEEDEFQDLEDNLENEKEPVVPLIVPENKFKQEEWNIFIPKNNHEKDKHEEDNHEKDNHEKDNHEKDIYDDDNVEVKVEENEKSESSEEENNEIPADLTISVLMKKYLD